ncbi:nuclease SbcCD subunit D [Nitritalea halalkaliphila LW7]|uniref:Nuclease SbcCD subunit D n=1 Tax=Nitritalea halalkaliphila LW7 TaxID=1189621 RepID=I5C0R6_9BACT|nr:exonuclease subunit SbcD [Nitritalea halalkaliphila]EIM75418.1 nuclease SbcCD subunit D [Nitritalea halalkaliphila LW7]
MLKILHTADWHLGKRLQEFSRLEEQRAVCEELIQRAEEQDVDLILLAGDIFDTFNPNHEAVELLYRTLRRLSKGGQRPIIAISGNHDSTQFIEAPDPLARELGILFYSRYDTVLPTGRLDSGIEITASAPGFVALRLPQHPFPIRILLAPYANEVLLKRYLGEEDREEALRELLKLRWQELADTYFDEKGVNLFIGHFFFIPEGASPEPEPESERSILHVGGTQALFTSSIPAGTQYAALGHLHRCHQVDPKSPFPIYYAGSPLAYSFSEAEQHKHAVLVKALPGQKVHTELVPLHSGRPLYRKRFQNTSEALSWLEAHPDCLVEITLCVEEAIDAVSRKQLLQAHPGIVHLIPERQGQRSATQAIRAADLEKDMLSLFRMYVESSQGQPPSEELLTLFKEITSQENPSS